MRAAICWLFMLLCLAAAPAAAERRVALIVANGAYANAALANPSVDAAMVKQALVELGFEVVVVADASLEAFDTAISDFALRARGADLALFYYAGHGFAVADRGVPRNYLMSIDADVTSTSERVLRAGGIPLDDVIAAVSEQAKTTLVFVDACRNDPRVSRAAGGRGRSAVAIDRTFGESVFVGLSTRVGDVALDGAPGRGSPFATAFAQKIGTPGKRLDDVFTDIRLSVEAETARAQRPDVGRYDLMAPVVLKPAAPVAPAAPVVHVDPCRDAAAHWAAISERKERMLFEEHLEHFPSCRFASLARLRLAELVEVSEVGAPTSATEMYSRGYAYYAGKGAPREYAKAREWWEKAAALGSSDAMYAIGILYQNGQGVAQDFVKAREWYEKAAALGVSNAMDGLGWLYREGHGVSQDFVKARDWYEKAGALGNSGAMFNLGVIYRDGQGVPQDDATAREWFAKAATLGNSGAMYNLAILRDRGEGSWKDSDSAARLVERAMARKDALAVAAMRSGAVGWSVEFRKALQTRLKAAGVYPGAIDGNFGPDTIAAIDAIVGKPE